MNGRRLGTYADSATQKNTQEAWRPYVALEHVAAGAGHLIPDAELSDSCRTDAGLAESGDVLFGKLRPYLAKVVQVDVPMMCSPELLVVRPRPNEIDSRFLYWLLLSVPVVEWAVATSVGVKMPRTDWSELSNFRIDSLPPVGTQCRIAEYLDRECAAIDEMLAEEERLGDLLGEAYRARRRLLLDSHRSDFANAHLRYVTTCLDSKRIPLNAQERAVRAGDFPYWGANAIVGHVDDYLFDEDLVLVGEDGAPFFDPRKDVAFCVSGKIWVNNHAHVLRPASAILPDYLRHVLNTTEFSRYISGSTRDKLTQADMGSIEVPVPPLETQAAAVFELSEVERRLGATRAEIADSQELLRERRKALITAAVTGQMEVA